MAPGKKRGPKNGVPEKKAGRIAPRAAKGEIIDPIIDMDHGVTTPPARIHGHSKWDPAHCQTVIALAEEGMLPEEWIDHFDVVPPTFYRWLEVHPDFRHAVYRAYAKLAAQMARRAREMLSRPGHQQDTRHFWLMMERRFPEVWLRGGLTQQSIHDYLRESLGDDAFLEEHTGTMPGLTTAQTERPEATMTDDEIEAELAALRARRAITEK